MKKEKLRLLEDLNILERKITRLSRVPVKSLTDNKKEIAQALGVLTLYAKDHNITSFNKKLDYLKNKNFKLMGL